MGMWGIVKKALNSTVGTSGFMPLDELITEKVRDELAKSEIVDDYVIGDDVSVALLTRTSEATVSATSATAPLAQFTAEKDGKVAFDLVGRGYSTSRPAYLAVFTTSGAKTAAQMSSADNKINLTNSASADWYLPVSVEKGVTYYVYLTTSNSSNPAYYTSLKVLYSTHLKKTGAVKRIQRGSVADGSNSSATVKISIIDTEKSVLLTTSNDASTLMSNKREAVGEIVNLNTIALRGGSSSGSTHCDWTLIEFW